MGRELNPRTGKFDWKFFCELRPGLIGWVCEKNANDDELLFICVILTGCLRTEYADMGIRENRIHFPVDFLVDNISYLICGRCVVVWGKCLCLSQVSLKNRKIDPTERITEVPSFYQDLQITSFLWLFACSQLFCQLKILSRKVSASCWPSEIWHGCRFFIRVKHIIWLLHGHMFLSGWSFFRFWHTVSKTLLYSIKEMSSWNNFSVLQLPATGFFDKVTYKKIGSVTIRKIHVFKVRTAAEIYRGCGHFFQSIFSFRSAPNFSFLKSMKLN